MRCCCICPRERERSGEHIAYGGSSIQSGFRPFSVDSPGFGAPVWPSPHLELPDTLLSTNFELRAGGETVRLTDPSGCRADEVDPGQMYADESYGRKPDGSGPLGWFLEHLPVG